MEPRALSPEPPPPSGSTPKIYNFEIYGARSRILGASAFASDAEAVEFAQATIRDLVRAEGENYSGCTLLITEAGRTVALIPIVASAGS